MSDIIRLLPDTVANQIAAGEVIQRPASVVKELVENAIDAGATQIQVIIKDGGKTFIQVIDNGCGMSETDARMAFERHATSKICSADDLFSIRTMGFRGEALASIAAVSEVELKTRLKSTELGTHISIADSKVLQQVPINCPEGSNFIIKNLFFNVPARRKFLKNDTTETRHIITEFQRLALANTMISFVLIVDDKTIYQLKPENIYKRIISVFGKSISQNLLQINNSTKVVEITGYIGKPEFARKSSSEQFFFVNNRFMKHPYFHKAVVSAYEKILSPDLLPSYFIYFEIDPSSIDINIHPTKTEIKFEEEKTIWQILQATVKQSLGKFNVFPSLDFEQETAFEIPHFDKNREINIPEISYNPNYNPFKEDKLFTKPNRENIPWEILFESDRPRKQEQNSFISSSIDEDISEQPHDIQSSGQEIMQLKNKFILVPVKSGLMIIDQTKAHQRILFEQYLHSLVTQQGIAQQNLFPQTLELNPADCNILNEILEELNKLGFDIRTFGQNSFVIHGCPAEIHNPNAVEIVMNLLNEYKETQNSPGLSEKEKVAFSLAQSSAIRSGQKLTKEEMQVLVDQLFACNSPNFSPSGKPTLIILTTEDLDKMF
jgi:DNA mismatch repair protein MutL